MDDGKRRWMQIYTNKACVLGCMGQGKVSDMLVLIEQLPTYLFLVLPDQCKDWSTSVVRYPMAA